MLRTPSRDSTVVVSLAGITICKIYLADSILVKGGMKRLLRYAFSAASKRPRAR
jgi:hypothetical protein